MQKKEGLIERAAFKEVAAKIGDTLGGYTMAFDIESMIDQEPPQYDQVLRILEDSLPGARKIVLANSIERTRELREEPVLSEF